MRHPWLWATVCATLIAGPALAQDRIVPGHKPARVGSAQADILADPDSGATFGAANPLPTAAAGFASTAGSGAGTGSAVALFSGATPAHGWKVSTNGAANCYVSDEITSPSSTAAGSYTVFAGGGQYSTEPGQLPVGPVYLNCPNGQAYSAQKW